MGVNLAYGSSAASPHREVLAHRLEVALASRSLHIVPASPGAVDQETLDRRDFARSVRQGLRGSPRRLSCRFLYDAAGSRLYEAITRQPEYYPTRTEAALLQAHAPEIAEATGPVTLVELGAGISEKSRLLLQAYLDRSVSRRGGPAGARSGPRRDLGRPPGFIPVDVSASAISQGLRALAHELPEVRAAGLHGTYEQAFSVLGSLSPVLVVFLGSTIGNLSPAEADSFWARLSSALRPGDWLLVGADLVKSPSVLHAAYNDRAGMTAAFTCNLFARMNRELGTGLDLDAIRHEAYWSSQREQVEIFARFLTDQVVSGPELGEPLRVRAGERVLVEISRKFHAGPLGHDLARHGLAPERTFVDPRGWFTLILAKRSADSRRSGG